MVNIHIKSKTHQHNTSTQDPVHGKYLLAGAFGDFSCSSLYANKQITAGDGGWVHSISEEHAPRLKSLINHGFDPAFMNRG